MRNKMLKRLSLENYLWLIFGLVVLVLFIISVAGVKSRRAVNWQYDDMMRNNIPEIHLANKFSKNIYQISEGTKSIVLLKDSAAIKKEELKIADVRKEYAQNWARFMEFAQNENSADFRKKILKAAQIAEIENDKVLELAKNNKNAEAAKMLLTVADPLNKKWHDILDEYIAYEEDNNVNQTATAVAISANFEKLLITVSTLFSPLLLVVTLFAIKRFVSVQKRG